MQNLTSPGDPVDWYDSPLAFDDIVAGGFLVVFGSVFLPLYALVSYVMFKSDKDIIGFRFLFSASLADMLLIFNYSIWPGLTILFKNEILPIWSRHWVQMYLDWAWFSMCYHYSIIAWSRFAAIKFPNNFRTQPRFCSYSLCACCYFIAFIQVLATHFQPWYVTFYYEPEQYGMLSEDFEKYLTDGQSFFFFMFHLLMMVIPIGFYGFAIILLLKHRNSTLLNGQKPIGSAHSNVEARLIIPCVFNSIVFIIGQVVITIGTGEGKWATWTVMLLFSANSAVNPLLLLLFSPIIRRKIWQLFGLEPVEAKYITVRGISCTPSPPINKSPNLLSTSRSTLLLAKLSQISREGYSSAF